MAHGKINLVMHGSRWCSLMIMGVCDGHFKFSLQDMKNITLSLLPIDDPPKILMRGQLVNVTEEHLDVIGLEG
jgi:hypothetical protein